MQDVEYKYMGMLRWGSTSWTKSKWKGGQLVIQQQQQGQKRKMIIMKYQQHEEGYKKKKINLKRITTLRKPKREIDEIPTTWGP